MGGTHKAKGNTTFATEFNIFSDPEAGYIVFEAFEGIHFPVVSEGSKRTRKRPKLRMISWELTIEHGIDWLIFDELVRYPTPAANFLKNITLPLISLSRKIPKASKTEEQKEREEDEEEEEEESPFVPCDAYAVAVVLFDDIASPSSVFVKKSYDLYGTVELKGSEHTYGQTIFNWWRYGQKSSNVEVVEQINTEMFIECLHSTFRTVL